MPSGFFISLPTVPFSIISSDGMSNSTVAWYFFPLVNFIVISKKTPNFELKISRPDQPVFLKKFLLISKFNSNEKVYTTQNARYRAVY